MDQFKEKRELPVLVVAVLIFLSSIGFLIFAVYYIAYLPVPMAMQPLKVRILTALKVEEVVREADKSLLENSEELENEEEIEEEL